MNNFILSVHQWSLIYLHDNQLLIHIVSLNWNPIPFFFVHFVSLDMCAVHFFFLKNQAGQHDNKGSRKKSNEQKVLHNWQIISMSHTITNRIFFTPKIYSIHKCGIMMNKCNICLGINFTRKLWSVTNRNRLISRYNHIRYNGRKVEKKSF